MRDEAEAGARFRDMPTNVRRFTILWLASLLIDCVVFLFMPVDTSDIAISPTVLFAVSYIVLLALLLPPLWFAVWRRKNWARMVLLGFFVLGLPTLAVDPIGPDLFLDFGQIRTDQLIFVALDVLSSVVDGVALFFLFSGHAKPWFETPGPTAV